MTDFLSGIFEQGFVAVHKFVEIFTSNPNISFGVAIILFTIIARLLLLPLSLKQSKTTAKMNAIQPQMKKIQERYKNDPQRQQNEMMKLYKDNEISPFGGCLPMLIQFPLIIALFYVFQGFDYQGAGFLWMKDLMAPDKTMIMPILSGLTTYFSSKIMAPSTGEGSNPTSMMTTVMAIFFGFMSINFPSALVLYWTVSNIIQMIQSYVLNKIYTKPKSKAA